MGLEKRMAFRLDQEKARKLSQICSYLGMTESAFIRLLIDRSLPFAEMIIREIERGARSPQEIFSRLNVDFERWAEGWALGEYEPEFFEALAHKYLEIAELWRKKKVTQNSSQNSGL
jgi:predicted DNA-binding protein